MVRLSGHDDAGKCRQLATMMAVVEVQHLHRLIDVLKPVHRPEREAG